MKGAPVVVAIQFVALHRELREGMCAIDDDGDVVFAAESDDVADWIDLARHEDDVADEDQFSFWCDGSLIAVDKFLFGLRGGGEGDLDELDSVAFLARLEGCDHARIVLIGGEDFIAGLEIKTEEAGFE